MGQFVAKILGSTEDVWGKIFQQSKSQYHAPTLSSMTARGVGLRHGAIGHGLLLLFRDENSTSTSRSSAT
jgi:predicted metalloprotease